MINSIYYLVITSRYCTHEIRINDLHCFNNHTGNQSGSEVPINELLINGINSIRIKIKPIEIENTGFDIVFNIKAKIEERDFNDNSLIKELLILESEVPIAETPELLNGQFAISEEFIEHAYFKLPVIELKPETLTGVYDFYKKVQNLMVSKDINSLMKYFESKEKEYAEAYNLEPQKRIDYVRNSLNGYITEPGADFLGMGLEFLEFQVYGFGKLICLEEKKTKRPAVGIFSEVNQTTSYFPMYMGVENDEIKILK